MQKNMVIKCRVLDFLEKLLHASWYASAAYPIHSGGWSSFILEKHFKHVTCPAVIFPCEHWYRKDDNRCSLCFLLYLVLLVSWLLCLLLGGGGYCRLLSLMAILSRASLWTLNWLEIRSIWKTQNVLVQNLVQLHRNVFNLIYCNHPTHVITEVIFAHKPASASVISFIYEKCLYQFSTQTSGAVSNSTDWRSSDTNSSQAHLHTCRTDRPLQLMKMQTLWKQTQNSQQNHLSETKCGVLHSWFRQVHSNSRTPLRTDPTSAQLRGGFSQRVH